MSEKNKSGSATKAAPQKEQKKPDAVPPVVSNAEIQTAMTAPTAAPPQALAVQQMPEAARAFLADVHGEREVPNKIPIIKINHKEGGFIMPDGSTVPTVAGYPILYFKTRRYYESSPRAGQKGEPPTCFSGDMVRPSDDSVKVQADSCAECKMSKFKTARDGRGQACGTYTWVFLYNPAFGQVPIGVVIAPPSSIRVLHGTQFEQGYFGKCQAKSGIYETTWTTFGLKQEGDQVVYCVLVPTMGAALQSTPEELPKIKQLAAVRNQFHELMNSFRQRVPEAEDAAA